MGSGWCGRARDQGYVLLGEHADVNINQVYVYSSSERGREIVGRGLGRGVVAGMMGVEREEAAARHAANLE